MPAIAVVGCAMTDLVVYTPVMPSRGETVLGDEFSSDFGGKGANQAVAAACFGAPVTMIAALGDDDNGHSTIHHFTERGVGVEHITTAPGSTGVAHICVETDSGANRIVVVLGANAALSPEDAADAVRSTADLQVVVGQLELDQRVTAAAFAAARARGATTILNPAPAAEIQALLLSHTDWLVPNEVEFRHLANDPHADIDDESIRELAEALRCRIVVTLGERGAVLLGADGRASTTPAPSVDAVDTVAAGDCFIGAFAFGLAHGLAERRAVELAVAAASLSVSRRGSQSSYPNADEVATLLQQVGLGRPV